MSTISLVTRIEAPIERVFDLVRCIDLHLETPSRRGHQAIAGVTTGLIGDGETVTWRAREFGFTFEHSSRITEFLRPTHFRDSMVKGPFKRVDHDHYFVEHKRGTLMFDIFDFTPSMGPFGMVADALLIRGRLSSLLRDQNQWIRKVAVVRRMEAVPSADGDLRKGPNP